jgi:AMMECR1 domain-containing protein
LLAAGCEESPELPAPRAAKAAERQGAPKTKAAPASSAFGPIAAGRTYPVAPAAIAALTSAALRGMPKLTSRPDYAVAGVLLPWGPLDQEAIHAAPGWKLLDWGVVQRVVLLIPAGARTRSTVAVPDFDRWVGPWGEVPIERDLARTLAGRFDFVKEDRAAFKDAGLAEAQLPLMLAVAGGVRLLPVLLGDDTAGQSRRLSAALLEVLPIGPTTLVVALGAPPVAASDAMAALRPNDLRKAMREGKVPDGTLGAVSVALDIARALRSDPPRRLTEGTDITSFAMLVRTARGKAQAFKPPALAGDQAWTDKLQKDVLEIAKKSVVGHVVMGYKAKFGAKKGGLGAPSGVFVSIRVDGQLRGRSGVIEAGAPLGQATADAAFDAAVRAKPPIKQRDLSSFEIEVTVPGPLGDAGDLAQLTPGRVGLAVQASEGGLLGVVLPQEAEALGWAAPEALRHACMNAALPPECRNDPDATWKTFAARVFRTDPTKPLPPLPPGPARQYGPAGSGLGLAREPVDK